MLELIVDLIQHGWHWFCLELENHPFHVVVDAIMVAVVIYVIRMPVHKAKDPSKMRPTKEEEEELIAEFVSAPFEVPEREDLPEAPVVEQYSGVRALLDTGKEVTNLSSFDFLAYATDQRVVEAAQDTIVKYGCGSCGPRGFYGSLKPHLDLETRLAEFMGTEAGIIYSFSFATISTLIPCFSARGDEILADDQCHFAIQIGCKLARSHLSFFRHNDPEHLEELMKASHARQKKKGKRDPPRRTLILEGVYRSTGCVANLPRLVELAKKYKYRIILDDSLGFAALGKTGRGTPEHFGMKTTDIEIYVGAMSTSLGTVGGFCVGASAMVDHQRLAATGYVFSAALPPYASVAAVTILDIIDKDDSRVTSLRRNAAAFRTLFTSKQVRLPKTIEMLHTKDSIESPVVHFSFVPAKDAVTAAGATPDWSAPRKKIFAAVQDLVDSAGIMVAGVKYTDQERVQPPPSLRVSVKSELTKEEVVAAAKAVAAALEKQFA